MASGQAADTAELSSLNTSLDEMADRLAAMAERLGKDEETSNVSVALFDAERQLRGAARAMTRARIQLQD